MTDESLKQRAQEVYETLCQTLDHRGWKYQKDEAELVIHFGVRGDALPMGMILVVDAPRQLIRVMSPMPFNFDESKRADGAIAVCTASYRLAEGNFDYNLNTGRVVFRMTASYRDSDIGEGLFRHLIDYSCTVVDAYNDKFQAINEGNLEIMQFVSAVLS